jgi:hypothetical protein
MSIIKELESYKSLIKKISDAIDYDLDYWGSEAINVMEDVEFAQTDGMFNFDRGDVGDMWEFTPFVISSTAMKGDKYYQGEIGGYRIFMGYEEDAMWDTAQIFIFQSSNEVKWNENL